MRKLIFLFSVVLAVQIGLVVWVYRTDDQLAAFNASQPFVDVDVAEVDQIIIEADGEQPLVMKREEGEWVLPDRGGFPVSSRKLDAFLKKLSSARPSWPVGRTAVAQKQLEVAEDSFERKIRLVGDGEVLGALYIGSSPGFRKVHARLEGAPTTHVIDFNAFDAPTDPADWYDRDLLRLSEEAIERVDLGAFALQRGEKGFELEGLAEDEQLEHDKVNEVLQAVTTLGFQDELGDEGEATFEQSQIILEYTVTPKEGNAVEYTVVEPSEADHYVLKASIYPYYFKVAKKKFDDLRAVKREQLVQTKPESVEGRASTVESQKSSVEHRTSNVEAGQTSEGEGQQER